MVDSGQRFRNLRGTPSSGDLFEHFGVDSQPTAPSELPTTVVAASPCRRCGWFVAIATPDLCPLCREPQPLRRTTPAP